LFRLVSNFCFIAEACKPVDFGLAAEPGELALGVVAVALLGAGDSLRQRHLAFDGCERLFVAERGQGPGVGSVPGCELASFFHQSILEHGCGALVDAGVEGFAVRVESDAQDTIAVKRVASGLPSLCHWLASGEADLDGADELGRVVGMDLLCRFGVEAGEDAVQPSRSFGGFGAAEASANGICLFGRSLWSGEEPVDEGAEVESCSSSDDGEFFSSGDIGEGGAGEAAVVAGGEGLGRIDDVDQVVRDLAAFGWGGFGGADLHLAIDGNGVAADDFSGETVGEIERKCRFAAGGGAEEDDQ